MQGCWVHIEAAHLWAPRAEGLVEQFGCLPIVQVEHRHGWVACGDPTFGGRERIGPCASNAEHRRRAARPCLVNGLAARTVALAAPPEGPAVVVKRRELRPADAVPEQLALLTQGCLERTRRLDPNRRARRKRLAHVSAAALGVASAGGDLAGAFTRLVLAEAVEGLALAVICGKVEPGVGLRRRKHLPAAPA